MATRTIGMPISWHHQDTEASSTKTQPAEIRWVCAAQTHGTLVQPWITTDYLTGLYQRQTAFACLDRLICLPKFTPDQHVSEVYNELCDSNDVMPTPAKRKTPKNLKQTLQQTATGERDVPVQRVTNFRRWPSHHYSLHLPTQ